MKPRSLHGRLLWAFAAVALLPCVLFGGYGLVFMLMVEDHYLERWLDEEVRHQQTGWQAQAGFAPPLRPGFTWHRAPERFPAELRARFAEEPQRIEFPGEAGRYYHLRRVELGGPAYLVAELGQELAVRPWRGAWGGLFAGSALAILGLSLGLGWSLARRLSRPLAALARCLHTTPPERLPEGLPERAPDAELQTLLDHLRHSLARNRAALERERHFTRDASHELRTPIAVLLSTCTLLREEAGLTPSVQARLGDLEQAAGEMRATVDSLLALAREETGGEAPEALNLLALVEDLVLARAAELDAKAMALRLDIPADARVLAPRRALDCVLANLLGNALRHGLAGEIRIHYSHGALYLDNPAAAPEPQLRAALGQPGLRAAGSPGEGLGLSLVQRLCARLGWCLDLDYREDGEFRVRLGLQAA